MTDAPRGVNLFVISVPLGQHEGMTRFRPLLIALTALTACAPLTIYYKPGVAVARLQSDQTRCEVAALRDAPVATQIRQRPPIYFPGPRICDASGACYSQPGYWVDGGIYTVDLNADLRGRVTDQCMAAKGYQPVTIPLCPGAVSSAPPMQTTTLPALTANSCAIRNQDGSWHIVSR